MKTNSTINHKKLGIIEFDYFRFVFLIFPDFDFLLNLIPEQRPLSTMAQKNCFFI